MCPLLLILKEVRHRKGNSLLSVLALLLTVALLVAFFTFAKASRRETTRVTRDLGFNLRIIPKATDMDRFWATGYSDLTMPETTYHRLAAYPGVFRYYNHLVACLQQRFWLAGKEVILTGLSPAAVAPGQGQQPMGFAIRSGTVFVGFEVARRLGLKKKDALPIGRRRFVVERCLVESGTDDDLRVFGLLSDLQSVLNLEGSINEIKAIDCLCLTADQDPLKILRAKLEAALPEAKVIQIRSLADARAKQRQMVEKYFGLATPLLLVMCAVWVGVLAAVNVRDRRQEIGILRALGHGSGKIGVLFLGKAIAMGLLGAVSGYAIGTALALAFGPEVFQVTAPHIQPELSLLAGALLVTPLFAALASFIPAILAVTQDPAETLREV